MLCKEEAFQREAFERIRQAESVSFISSKGEGYACPQEQAYQHSPLKVQRQTHRHHSCPSLEQFRQHLRRLAVSAVQVLIEQVMCEELDESHWRLVGRMHAPSAEAIAMGPPRVTWSRPPGALRLSKSEDDREGTFHSQVFERYQRYEAEVAEALTQMFGSAVSTHKVGEVTQTLLGGAPSASAVSRLNQRLPEPYAAWRERPLLPH